MSVRKPSSSSKGAHGPLMTYGCQMPGQSQFFYDTWAFGWKRGLDCGTPRRADLFRRITDQMIPGRFEWHSWTERMIEALCEHQWVGIAGAAGTAKTFNVANFACAWWMCMPEESSVIFCSTTAKMLRKRGWADVQKFHTSVPGPRFGNFVDSRMMWQAQKGDDRHAIMGIAVEEGEATKIADNIKGVHTLRQMVIVDEATRVPPAIYDACTNLWSYPQEFMLVLMGNPRLRLDEFGKFCEPFNGWESVTVDTEEWDTTQKLNGKTGVVIRFDAERSPNIVEGKLVSRHLPKKEEVEAARNRAGSADDPTYWSNQRGFWAPESINRNVFSETALIASDAYGKHLFTGTDFKIIGALDHSRGGDRPVIRFGAMGEIAGGKQGIEWMLPITLSITAKSSNPIDFQIADQCQRACERVQYRGQTYQCLPEDFGIDATGGGADFCDICQRTWSPLILRVEFNAGASEDPCSFEDVRPAKSVYKNKRSEMYFRTRAATNSQQLKGIDKETASELCNISYDERPLIVLMDKKVYKKLFGKSPDLADSGVILQEVARRRGFKLAAQGMTKELFRDVSKVFEKSQAVYEDVDYSAEELEPVETW